MCSETLLSPTPILLDSLVFYGESPWPSSAQTLLPALASLAWLLPSPYSLECVVIVQMNSAVGPASTRAFSESFKFGLSHPIPSPYTDGL